MLYRTHDRRKTMNHITIKTARLTYVKGIDRPKAKNWAGQDVIRIQAYKNPGVNQKLHRGAEIPVGDTGDIIELIAALCRLCGP